MAKILSFRILNFKGASDVEIKFDQHASSPVVMLIGLNESGKTTILEALSYYVSGDNAVSSLFEESSSKASRTALIPIHRKAAFTGEIRIEGIVELNDADRDTIAEAAEKLGFEIDRASLPPIFAVSRAYDFVDSVEKSSSNYWDFPFLAKKKGSRRFKEFYGKASSTEDDEVDLWLKLVVHTQERCLPRIAYFPTFIVNLPKQIYLKEHDGEDTTNLYYRTVLQDVLDSLDEGLSLKTHVSDRIDAFFKSNDASKWFTRFLGGPSKGPIDAVFQKMSAAITREVLGSWEKVFNRRIGARSISVEWNIDTQKGNMPYAAFSVTDGESKYALDERSLGFRWFFSFLLFTTFKQKAKRPTIFLFDEPAANLHAKAQAELLKSFSRITAGEDRIVYSTHSHHMIDPRWLSAAYIVENTAIDHDADDPFGLTTKPTNVVATSYRQFVASSPQRTSYFQPVIEKLEYVTPEVIGSSPFLLVEGITDYYALRFLLAESKDLGVSLMPGCGAGASGPQISSLIGRGERFLILLDDDRAGRAALERYRSEWLLSDRVATLADVDVTFAGACLETLLSENTKEAIGKAIGSAKPSKKEIGWYLAELCTNPKAVNPFDEGTKANLLKVLRFAADRFGRVG